MDLIRRLIETCPDDLTSRELADVDEDAVTWCRDSVYQHDVKYVRADLVEEGVSAHQLRERVEVLWKALRHAEGLIMRRDENRVDYLDRVALMCLRTAPEMGMSYEEYDEWAASVSDKIRAALEGGGG